MGGYEPDPKPWAPNGTRDGIPEGFHFSLLDPDWDHFEQFMAAALARVPALAEAGVKQLINGPESFTPGWQLHPRRGAGAERLLRRLRLQRVRHRGRRRRRQGARRVDRGRRAALRPLAGRHPPLRRAARRRRLGARAHARALRQALHDRLAGRGAQQRPAAPALAALAEAQGCRRRVRREARLGARQLVRPSRARTSRATSTASAARTGSTRWPRSTAPAASGSRCSMPPPSPS